MNKDLLLEKLKDKKLNKEKIFTEAERRLIRQEFSYIDIENDFLSNYLKAIEELGELQQAILKFLETKSIDINLIEEISDVEIMLEQLKDLLNIDKSDIEYIKDIKYERQKDRVTNNNL